MPSQQLSSRPHAKDKHGCAASITLQEIHGGMWSKGSKGAWTWLKARSSSGRTNNASKGVDESVWAVQLVEHAGTKVTKGRWSCWEKELSRRGMQPPGPVSLGRPTCPIKCTPGARLLQASSSLLPLFVCSSFYVQNHHRLSQPSQAWLLKQFTPLIHSKSTFRSNSWSA
jgi:hypothetical protein